MSVGKSSISRMVKAKPAEGIRSLAPEVPVGDAATPVSVAEKKAPVKKTVGKKAPAKKAAPKTEKKSVAKKAAKAPVSAPKPKKLPTYEIGQELPYWRL